MADPRKIQTLPAPRPTGWGLALDRAPQFLSVLLIFFLPFSTQLQGAHPLFPKWALTQMLVSLMLGAWALKIFRTGRLVWVYSRALAALLLFLLWCMATLAFSPYPGAGWIAFRDCLSFPLWYILLTFSCIELWQAENLLVVLLVAGLGTSLWALGQWAGMGGEWQEVVRTRFGGRVVAGLGDPDSLAGYLLMIWPLALGLLIRAERTLAKWFWALVFAASLAALFLTASKAGWSGFAAGAIVFSLLLLRDRGDKEKKVWGWIAVLLLLLLVSVFLTPMGRQLQGALDRHNEPVQFQEEIWKGAAGILKDHPLTGTGFGTFAAAFPSHRPAAIALRQASKSYEVDHACNWVLELAAETGLPGLSLMLVFGAFVLGHWWKLYSAHAIPRSLAAGVFAAAAGVAVDNLFDMNSGMPSTLVPLLFLAAFPVALSQRFYRLEGFPIRLKEADLSGYKGLFLPLAVLAAVAFLGVGDAFQRQWADVDLKRASTQAQEGDWDGAVSLYGVVLQRDPSNIPARYSRGVVAASRLKPGDLEQALADFEAVGRVEPDFHLLHFKKYQVLRQLGREPEAEGEFKRAVQLDPTVVYLLPEFQAARRLAATRKYSQALIIYQKLVLDYPTCVPALVDEANCLLMSRELTPALEVYRQVLRLDPDNPDVPQNLKRILPETR